MSYTDVCLLDSLRHETNAVISWLQQLQPLSRLNHIPQKGTCLWIQESREWLAWVESKFDKPLWISGPPGVLIQQHFLFPNVNTITLLYIQPHWNFAIHRRRAKDTLSGNSSHSRVF